MKTTHTVLVLLALGLAGSPAAAPLLAEEPAPPLSDPMFEKQRALFDKLEVAKAWELTRGSPDELVGVVDLGFDFYHPDLRNRVEPGYYAPGAFHSEIIESAAHGTMVASLIVAEPDNGVGMSGLAPRCRVLTASIGLLDHTLLRLQRRYQAEHPNGDMTGWTKCMQEHIQEIRDYGRRQVHHVAVATAESVRFLTDRGAKVINLSLYLELAVIPSEDDRALLDGAFRYAREKDVVLVVGAGNNARESHEYPGDEASCLVVGATLLDDTRWEEEGEFMGRKLKQGSNFGKRLSVMAPIEDVVVAWPHDRRFYASDDGPTGATSEDFDGICRVERRGATSAATPIVAALAALVRSLRPDLTAAQVIDLIKKGCDDIGAPGVDERTGWGRVNFRKTLELAKGCEAR